MKLLLLAMLSSLPIASAWLPPVKADVYHWTSNVARSHGGRTDRAIVSGSTLDLESLEIHATTLDSGVADSGTTHDEDELFLMVKDGEVRVTQNGATRLLGAGSVAVALPGDRQVVANAGTLPATYYLFTYRSKAPMDLERGRRAGGSFIVDWNDLTVKNTAPGTRRDVFDRPTAMFKRFESHVSSVGEGLRNHATHTHRADEIMMMMQGQVELVLGDARPTAATSDVVFLGSMIPHSLGNTGSGSAQYLVIQGE